MVVKLVDRPAHQQDTQAANRAFFQGEGQVGAWKTGGIEDGRFVSQADHQPVVLALDLDLNLAGVASVSVDDDIGGCFVDRLDQVDRSALAGAQRDSHLFNEAAQFGQVFELSAKLVCSHDFYKWGE